MQPNKALRLNFNLVCALLSVIFIIGAAINIQIGKSRRDALAETSVVISESVWPDYLRLRSAYESAVMQYTQTLELTYDSLPDAEILPLPKKEDRDKKEEANAWSASGFDNYLPPPEAYQQAYSDLLKINLDNLRADKSDCANALTLRIPYVVDAESAVRMEGASMFSNFLWEKTIGPLWSRGSEYDSRRKTESFYDMVLQINDDYRYLLYERLEELKDKMVIQNGRLEAALPYYEKLQEGYDEDLVKALYRVSDSYWDFHNYHEQAREVAFVMRAMHTQMVIAAPSTSAEIPVDYSIERHLDEYLNSVGFVDSLRSEIEQIFDSAASYTDALDDENFGLTNKDYNSYFTNIAFDGSLWLKRMYVTEITVNDWENRPLKIMIADDPNTPLYEFYYSGSYEPYLARRYNGNGELLDTCRWFRNYQYYPKDGAMSSKMWDAAIWVCNNMHNSQNGQLDASELYSILNA